jgi:hypothetical protein
MQYNGDLGSNIALQQGWEGLEKIQMLFESVVTVAFQNIFHLKIHQNNIFFIF